MGKEHIVYAAFDKNGNCLYVGEGKPDRYKHITSGVSHVYEANKWHFANKYIKVNILHTNLSKEDAIAKEKFEISKLKPAWNKCEYGTIQLMGMCRYVSQSIKDFVKKNPRHKGKQEYYITLAKDICKLLDKNGETSLIQGQSWNSLDIPVGFMSHLAKEGVTYYPVLKYVFDVSRHKDTNGYSIKLKDWLNQE